MPASVNACRAARWCSGSLSTVVSTPSGRMPRSSHSPDTPAPVPTSTTARAATVAARKRSAAPPPVPIGTQPSSRPRRRAAWSTASSARYASAYSLLASTAARSGTATP